MSSTAISGKSGVAPLVRGAVRQRVRVSALTLTAGLALAAISSCTGGGVASFGPLSNPDPGGQVGVQGGWGAVNPGQPGDYFAYVLNSARAPVTLASAELVAVPGVPVPRLAHIAVTRNHDTVQGRGWPPAGVKIFPFKGDRIGAGVTDLEFAMTGQTPGRNYGTAGLRVAYQYGGRTFHVMLWSASTMCVTTARPARLVSSACTRAGNRNFDAVVKLAAHYGSG